MNESSLFLLSSHTLSHFIYIPFLTHLSNLFKYYGNFAMPRHDQRSFKLLKKISTRDRAYERWKEFTNRYMNVSQRDEYKSIIYHQK